MTNQPATNQPDVGEVAQREFAAKLRALIKSFPSLQRYPLGDPDQPFEFDVAAFDAFAADEISDEAGQHAAAFVRAVWHGEDHEFDFIGAYAAWNSEHQAAFFRWCHSPFYPPAEGGQS